MEKHDSNRLENNGSWNTNHNLSIPSILLQTPELLIQVGGSMIVSYWADPSLFISNFNGKVIFTFCLFLFFFKFL